MDWGGNNEMNECEGRKWIDIKRMNSTAETALKTGTIEEDATERHVNTRCSRGGKTK